MKSSGYADAQVDPAIRKALYLESIFASGRTSPNPAVACVVASGGGDLLFRGSTEPPGGRHAEIVALDLLDAGMASSDFDLYVTLEPCSRQGRTPPCTLRISRYGTGSDFFRETGRILRRVFIGHNDPSLSGVGRRQLEGLGFSVVDLPRPGLYLPFLEPFFRGLRAQRPIFTIKVATDRDGLMGIQGETVNITGLAGRVLTMRLRAKCDAVLVGAGTTAVDHPSLDLRAPLSAQASPGGAPARDAEEGEEFQETSSFEWLDLEDRRHPLAWFRGLFEPGAGWERLDADAGLRSQFQPVRVFLLGRPFPGADSFFERQRALEVETGRPAIFFAHRSHTSDWPGIREIPDLEDPAFFDVLGGELASRGLQRILIESGKGMLRKWVDGMGADDRLVHVHSSKIVEPVTGRPLRLEGELASLRHLDRVVFARGLTADLYGLTGEGPA